MYLTTQQLMTPGPPGRPSVNEPIEYGWPDVRSGLQRILCGYLLAIGLVVLGVSVVFLLVYLVITSNNLLETALDSAMILYLTAAVSFVGGLYSLFLVISGKLRCLIHVPERCGAKWLMFGSMLCLAFGPVLNTVGNLFGAHKTSRFQDPKAIQALMEGMTNFGEMLFKLEPRAYINLAGMLSSLASSVLFVLFMRQVCRCFEDGQRMRLAEFYLAFCAVVLAGTVFLFLRLVNLLQDIALPLPGAQIQLPPTLLQELETIGMAALMLAAGWLLAVVWFLLLIGSTSRAITVGLAIRRVAQRIANGRQYP
jgi:hypothetical protein